MRWVSVKIFIISCYFIETAKNVYLKVYYSLISYKIFNNFETISAQSENTTGIMLNIYKNINLMN
jgi:hypothetical protein